MMHPNTELRFINPEKGYGVVATKAIPKGTITWALDPIDQHFTSGQIQGMDPYFQGILKTYCYRDHQGVFVLCWDHARFVNHSFHSNCVSTAYNVEIAVRDIGVGEELTDDYGYLNIIEPFYCLPEPNTSRTKVMPDDLLHFYPEWDAQLEDAFKVFNEVPQPMWHMVEPQHKAKIKGIANGTEKLDSILNCYYHNNEEKVFAV